MWIALTTDDIAARFNNSESTGIDAAKGDANSVSLPAIISGVVNEIQDACKARTTDIGPANTIPAGFKTIAISAIIFQYINSLPAGESLLNKARVAANSKYEEWLKDLRAGKVYIPPQNETNRPSLVNWNARNRIVLRTEPTLPPSQQLPPTTSQPGYANPNAPADD